jgi:hypothetical protein
MRNFLHITNSFRYFQYLLLNWQHMFDIKCNRVTVLRLQLLFVVTSYNFSTFKSALACNCTELLL